MRRRSLSADHFPLTTYHSCPAQIFRRQRNRYFAVSSTEGNFMASIQGLSSITFPTPGVAELLSPKLESNKGQAIRDISRDFEAMFLSLLLKEMRQTLDPEQGLFPGDPGDVQGGLYDMFMGNALADSGGVGMAAALQTQLKLQAGQSPHDDGSHDARRTVSGASRP
jgi:peptidoglycan hydrolase FlgJ